MFFTNLLHAKSKVSSYQNHLQLFVAENVTTYRLWRKIHSSNLSSIWLCEIFWK